jgi:PAS domain S-box-containing protein
MKLSPFRIAVIYIVIAMIWIVSTDSVVGIFFSDPEILSVVNIVKGLFYVVSTGIGLFYLIKIYEQEINQERLKLQKKDKSLTLALESNKMATWEYYPKEDRYLTSSNHHQFFDYPQSTNLKLKDVFTRVHPDDLDRFKKEVSRTFDSHQSFNIEYRVVYTDGAVHWLWTRGTVQTSNGEIESVSGITSDITESKSLKRKLDLEREKFETLFDRIPVLINVYNPELNINEVNQEFEKVLGYDASKEYGKDPISIFYPDSKEREKAIEHMSNPGAGWKEFEIRTTSGEKRYQLWDNVKLSDSTLVGIGYDITDRKELELKESSSRKRLLDIFNKLPIFINIIDENNIIVESNDFMKEKFGYVQEDAAQDDLITKMVPEDVYDEAKAHMQAADNSWKDFEMFTRSGETLKTRWMNMQLDDTFTLGVGIDLTEISVLEEQLSLAVKGGNVGLWDYYPKEEKILINDEYAKMLGYSKNELEPRIYSNWADIIHPEDLDKSIEELTRHFEGETSSYNNEIRLKHKNGSWIWVIVRGEVTERDDKGEVARFTGTHIDITDRKKLEEEIEVSRTRLKQATNSANIGLWEWNPQTGNVTIDEIWARLVGYTLDELKPVDINTWNKLVHPDDLERFENAVEDYFSGRTDLYEIEARMRHKDGHWVWILDRGKNLEWNEDGEPIKMIGTHVDITNLKLNEKRLEENERLLIETQRVANLGTFTENLKTHDVQTSKILDQMFWLTEGENLSSDRLIDMLHPDFKYVAEQYQRAIESGEPFEAEFKIQNPRDKRERWIYEKANVELDKEGNAKRAIGTMLDITRSKEQELRIKRTLAQLRKAEQIAEIGYWEKNLDTGKIYWGTNKYSLYNADPSQGPVTRQDFFQKVHPDDRKQTYDAYLDAENGKSLDVTYRYKQEDGSYNSFREKAEVVIDDVTGNEILRGISMDISSIRNIESQLEEEQERLRIITALVSDVIWEWNFEYDTITWSDGMQTMFGYKPEELPAGEESWTAYIHPEDKHRVLQSIEKARQSNHANWAEEYRFIDSSGKSRYVFDQGYIFRNEDGEAVKMVGAMIDQTESKESEELLTSQAQLLEDISDAVIATDAEMEIVSWNRAAEMMYGWSEQEAIGRKIGNLIKAEYGDESEESLRLKLMDEKEWSGEVIQYNRIDEPMNILSSVRLISDEDGNYEGAVAVNKDITAIKKIQEKLSYEQRRFEYATSVVSDAIWDANPNLGSVWWSEGLETHYKHSVPPPGDGYNVWKENLHPDDRERVLSTMKQAEESGANEWEQEYKFYRGDGSLAIVLDRALILRDDEGSIERIIGAMNDITLEKEAEKELKRSEHQYRLLYEQSPLPMYIFNKDTFKFISVNEALIDLFGYSEAEFLEMTIFELFLEDEQKQIRDEASKNLKHSHSSFEVWRQKTKGGATLYCEISGSDIYYKGNQQRLVLTLDITEQRKADERAIKAIVEGEERERHRIANELHDGLGQYLSAANMHLNTVYSDSEIFPDEIDRPFKTGLQMLEHAISETRSISHNLLPKAIQDYGLKMAVESLVNEIQSTQTMSVHLFQKYDDEIFPGNIQINIFRIIQEALNNALKHSGGSTININLVYSDSELICTVEDDGSGFDTENVTNEGLGLQSMKTRVAAMSGNLDIESKENRGTLITAIVPI